MPALPRLLIVEDDNYVRDTLSLALSSSYEVDLASSGKAALDKANLFNYDIIILDLNLPDISGKNICHNLRNRDPRVPILILSGDARVLTKIDLFNSGANDYLTKPFALGELKARLKVLSRQSRSDDSRTILNAYGVVLDSGTLAVTREGINIKLRPKEFEVLSCLIEHAGTIVSRQSLIDNVWEDSGTWTNTVDVHINHLREKLDRPFGTKLVHTIHGRGYKFGEAI